jgi:hypothetical protein
VFVSHVQLMTSQDDAKELDPRHLLRLQAPRTGKYSMACLKGLNKDLHIFRAPYQTFLPTSNTDFFVYLALSTLSWRTLIFQHWIRANPCELH